ncbi:MAG: YeiH family protein [Formivibrio sp.]|nr:YeiH family protein [Formivibrio sp.]
MLTLRNISPGMMLVLLLTISSTFLVQQAGLARYGISPLTLAIVLGAIFGNVLPQLTLGDRQLGLRFAQKNLLRAGVALYGFNLSLQQIAQVGSTGIVVDLFMVCSTLCIGWFVGTRLLGLDRETTMLTTAGSAICGAAAIVATVPMLHADEEQIVEKTSSAVATVVLFGTLAIFIYPALYAWIGGSKATFGIYIGSTVHEVAQVVAIGNIVGGDAARTAVIVKMIRVMLLVPFLLSTGALFRGSGKQREAITIPWFAVIFVIFAGINSLHVLPEILVTLLRQTGIVFLTAAMGALGLETTFVRLRKTGSRTFLLGLCLFVHLVVTGGLINRWLAGASF